MLKIEYKNSYIERLCIDEKFAQKELTLVAAKALRTLMPRLIACEDLSFFTRQENLGYHLEKLKGKHQYEMSLRVKKGENSCGYRMIFECTNTDIKDEYKNMTAIRILDINNHKY